MYFEVFDDPVNSSGDSLTRLHKTHLTRAVSTESVFALRLNSDENFPTGNIGYIEFVRSESERIITPTRVFPLGGGKLGGSGLIKSLEGKGISAAIEHILISVTPKDYRVKQSREMLTPRRLQLQSYGIEGEMALSDYLEKLKRSLSSPHFRIVKFPPWITDPEILQLGENR